MMSSESKKQLQEKESDKDKHVVQHVVTGYSGPIPSPQMMAEYEQVMPGAMKAILDLAKENSNQNTLALKNQAEEIELQKMVVKSNDRTNILGIISATFLIVFCLGLIVFCLANGYDVAAIAPAIAVIGIIFKTFFTKK